MQTPSSSSSIHSLIYACSKLNNFKQVLSLFSRLLYQGHVPDAFLLPTVVKACTALSNIKAGRQVHAIASACSQSGLTEEGQCYFNDMSKEHGIEPGVEHYTCMVSLLGRAGKLEEALLSFCRVHNNMTLGEIATKQLFKLEPTYPGNYILLSNIYAFKGKWREVNGVRDMMSKIGLRKDPGCSWIDVKPKAHMLLSQRHFTSSYDLPA